MRYGMMIELDHCIGCQACVTACKERWDSGPGAARDWVMTFTHGERGKDLGLTFYPGLCNHCDDHPCTADCPTGATYADEHGVVVVDPQVCIGCGNCVSACPYGARHADPRKGIVEKCNFCAPYVARGEAPACVATCLAECRHFGDLDDLDSEVRRLIAARGAKPLTTEAINIGPQVYYAPAAERLQVLAQGVVQNYRSTLFTHTWESVTRPLARWAVAPAVVAVGVAGFLVNLRARKHVEPAPASPPSAELPRTLPRHRAGMRFLHWFNVLSWTLLLVSGTFLFSTPRFALFGTSLPAWLAEVAGSRASLLWFHAAWGVLWAGITIPLFLIFKRGGIEALREVWPTYDDLRWLWVKPLVMLGLTTEPLPPQGKYNFGQKLFAISAVAGTALIVASGVVMTFHLGPAEVVRAAILVHKLAVMLALLGIAVHVTMAAIIVEERPALWSMIVGEIDTEHARAHNRAWVEELREQGHDGPRGER